MKAQAVIARYGENVHWVRDLPMPAVIYNKGGTSTGLEDTHQVIARPNVGREAETYLHYIVEQYETLPNWIYFLQGDPFDHCENLLDILKSPPASERFVPLGHNMKREPLAHSYNWDGFQESLHSLAHILGIKPTDTVRYVAGAQFAVPKRVVLRHPKSVYRELLLRVNSSMNPHEAWGMERLWGHLFGVPLFDERTRLDIVLLDGTENSYKRSMRTLEAKRSNVLVRIVPRERALDGPDLVLFLSGNEELSESALYDLITTYQARKMNDTGLERDPILMEPGKMLLWHHALLLQHKPLLSDIWSLKTIAKASFFSTPASFTTSDYPPILNDSFRDQWKRLVHLRNNGYTPNSILDIGAHHGGWSILAKSIWPNATVFSVEANEECRAKLAAHAEAYQIATLSKKDEEAIYWKCTEANNEGNSLYREKSAHNFTPTTVHTKTLKVLAGEQTFDFIKIDCQGSELDIISGGEEVVQKAQVILLESHIQEYNEGAPLVSEVVATMDRLGFRLYDIVELHHNKKGTLLQVDLLFVKTKNVLFKTELL